MVHDHWEPGSISEWIRGSWNLPYHVEPNKKTTLALSADGSGSFEPQGDDLEHDFTDNRIVLLTLAQKTLL